MTTCPRAHMPHVRLITHTQHIAFIVNELLQEEHAKMFSSDSLFPQSLSLPLRNAGAAASWTCLSNRTDFASWGGALPLLAFPLLPSVCSLSTLLFCLHPDMCALQWIYVMASCCGWPGGPSAMLLSMFSNG